MLGLSVDETSRRISFINALSGEARSSAISQLSRATGRNEAQVMHALESYNAAVHVGTADGATAEAAREGTSVYGRTREAAGYDFAERAGKRSEEHTSELQSLMRISYAVFCLKKKKQYIQPATIYAHTPTPNSIISIRT